MLKSDRMEEIGVKQWGNESRFPEIKRETASKKTERKFWFWFVFQMKLYEQFKHTSTKKVCISFRLTRLKTYSARFIYEMLEIHVCPLVSYFVFLLSKVITEKK